MTWFATSMKMRQAWPHIIVSVLCIFAAVSIIETAYLGLMGNHTFRQADAYGYILGILNQKDFDLFDLFSERQPWGYRAVFDIPLYEYLVAFLARLLDKDALVAVRYVNLGLWIVAAFFGYRAAVSIGNHFAGLLWIALFATSPLVLHYFSVPLPDVLAIASSLVATAILVQARVGLGHYAAALAFIVIASTVKSPVAFIFVAFSAAFLASRATFNETWGGRLSQSRSLWFLAAFLCCVLLAVAIIEVYRGRLMADVGSEAGHLWRWYFGTYDLRMSKDFWQVVLERFNGWQPPHFFAIFLGVIFLSLTLDRNPRALMALSASIVGFFAGWLVFANVYKIHDYYQLPAAIIVFLAFAIVLGSLIESLDARTWMSKRFIYSIQILTLMPFLYQAVAADALNHKERTDFWRAVEYLLRDDDIFLYVAENTNNPAIGGQVSTKFKGISPASLEDNCSDYLGAFKAVLFEGSQSICLDSAKVRAKHFIRDEGKVFLYVEDAQQPIEEASRNSY